MTMEKKSVTTKSIVQLLNEQQTIDSGLTQYFRIQVKSEEESFLLCKFV